MCVFVSNHAEGVDIVKIQILYVVAQVVFHNMDPNGVGIDVIHGNIGEADVFNVGGFVAHIAAPMLVRTAGQHYANAHVGIGHV